MKRSQDITDVGKELLELAQSLNRIHVLTYCPQVTIDATGAEETCVDCGCEVTAGDLTCERCDDIRQQTEQALSRGEE